uniref:Uncharacterized protein n=1 Tax=Brassica oleracea var. oleracea TaxID=109376 RepID=A0A0D3CQZ9_BRAOL
MRTDCEEDGSERIGSLTPSNKKSYKVTNRIQEGKKPLYDVVFNFFDSRFFNVFVTAGGNKVMGAPRRGAYSFQGAGRTSGAGTSSPPENGTSLPPRTGASLPPRTLCLMELEPPCLLEPLDKLILLKKCILILA